MHTAAFPDNCVDLLPSQHCGLSEMAPIELFQNKKLRQRERRIIRVQKNPEKNLENAYPDFSILFCRPTCLGSGSNRRVSSTLKKGGQNPWRKENKKKEDPAD
jgi:hypothetical protein